MLKLLETLLPFLQPVALMVLAAGLRTLTGIRKELHDLATTAARMQQWREDHENRHERESELINREIDHIHERLANGNGKVYTRP